MTRIPPVRQWRVRYYMDDVLLAEIIVSTINKRFARWLARDRFIAKAPERWLAASRVTVSLVRNGTR